MYTCLNRSLVRIILVATFVLLASAARAAVGVTEITGLDGDGPVTIYYPSSSEERQVARGSFAFDVALQGVPTRGNGRLIVISHGSGGAPWVHFDLARILVKTGFFVAMPEHKGDNYKDGSTPGPDSWKRRPAEVSRAIDAVAQDARFAALLDFGKVGMYGMSAGGHTALSLAGGRWSPAGLKQHCETHIAEDFHSCVGLATRLQGNILDGLKKSIALWVIGNRFDDSTWYAHTDPRIAALVAGVPYAADFDMASLVKPQVPLGLVLARQDAWLIPRFHGDAVLNVCITCEVLADLPNGGHGALLSPFPASLSGLVAELLSDPPGFDRSKLPEVDRKIAAFFRRHLLP